MQKILTDLQSLGIRMPEPTCGRYGGAGPAEGITLLIDNIPANIPIRAAYVQSSPYSLHRRGNRSYLYREEHELGRVLEIPDPKFYTKQTTNGVSYNKIALRHGLDCLASTVIQHCAHWRTRKQCTFCGIGLSLESKKTIARKSPGQLAEVAAYAQSRNEVSHAVLTTGSSDPPGLEIEHLAECTRAIKDASRLPVHVQFAPSPELDMRGLHSAGVDTAGIHIETFDTKTLAKIAPAKADIGLARYMKAWEKAVSAFGPGQVSSFLIVGLGEPPESVVMGSEILADMGVYPFVVPLRPIGNNNQTTPPDPEIMHTIYTAVARILKRKGLHSNQSRAGCVRCKACSALHTYESDPLQLICHTARTEEEIQAAMAIRKDVFVNEQKIFSKTDQDDKDAFSTLLVVKHNGQVTGTVRIYPDGDARWFGGRLAVAKEHRNHKVGRLLVREAMRRVTAHGCKIFLAWIQEKNVPFFEKIGWHTVGQKRDYSGISHQLMQADLNTIQHDWE